MGKIISVILAFCVAAAAAGAAEEKSEYSQTYVIFLDGSRAGKEVVAENPDEKGDRIVESENEIYVSDGMETKRMAFTTRLARDRKTLKPKSYSYQYRTGDTGDSCEVVIEGDTITRTLRRGGETSVVTGIFKPDTVILDFNVFYLYGSLARKYDAHKGGRQVYSGFIPVIGNDIPTALTYLGESQLLLARGNLAIRNYKIEYVGLRNGTLSVDSGGELVRLTMPDQKLEVIREDVLPANR